MAQDDDTARAMEGLAAFAEARQAAGRAQSVGPRLEIGLYEITDRNAFKANRTDGTGWDFCWANVHRDWMDRTSGKFAYRCLPLSIVNQTGLWLLNPVGFTAVWRREDPNRVDFTFDAGADYWKPWISNHFGNGIITWNTPFLIRTKPAGSRVLVMGPPNAFKENVQPLAGLVETDWASMTFTMNWKIIEPERPVRFELGEPIFHIVPIARNPVLDLENADVVYRHIDDDPEVGRSYKAWFTSRNKLHELQKRGEIPSDKWQMHYFRGVTLDGTAAPTEHFIRMRPPEIRYAVGTKVGGAEAARAAGGDPAEGIEAKLFAASPQEVRERTAAKEREAREAGPSASRAAARSAQDERGGQGASVSGAGPADAGVTGHADLRAPAPRPRAPETGKPAEASKAAPAKPAGGSAVAAPSAPAPQGGTGAAPVDGLGATTPGGPPAPSLADPLVGFRLRALRAHPRAAKVVPATVDGKKLGFHLLPPVDLDVIWYGGKSFDWKALTPFIDEEAPGLAALATRGAAVQGLPASGAAMLEGLVPKRKVDAGSEDGVLSLWTGLVVETPPGWALEVRAPAGDDASPLFAVLPAILDTDRAPRGLTLRLKFRATDRWAKLRGVTDPGEARPIAHLVPVRREACDVEWLAAQLPIEASKNAVDVLLRWRAAETGAYRP